ncbi:MAG: hypothetical protein ACLQC7_06320 [Thermoplasmata archaeon]
MVSSGSGRRLAVALTLGFVLLAALGTALPASAAPTPTTPIHGSISGHSVIATSSNGTYYINATGGPAFAANGTQVGVISWKAHVSGPILTGVTLSPNASVLKGSAPGVTHLRAGKTPETLTITVEIFSAYQSSNVSSNITDSVRVVVPYVVRAQLVVGATASVLGFDVTVDLDGSPVGTVSVPSIAVNGTYSLTYDYATAGLSPGEHTFTISLANERGLVTFAGGAIEYSQSFYIVGPPPNYPLYVLLGVVVFAGVLFIFVTRVAARRRPTTRK